MAGLVMIQNAFPPTIPSSMKSRDVEVNEILKINNLIITESITATSFSDGTATLTGGTLSGLVTPTSGTDAVNKTYVDSIVGGESTWKTSVLVGSTVNVVSISGLLTIDGTVVAAGDRVLLKDQSTATENGIYIAASGAWVRSTLFDTGYLAAGSVVVINSGTANATTTFQCTSAPGSDEVGTDNIIFIELTTVIGGSNTQIQFNDSGALGGSSALTWSGTTLATSGVLNVTNTTQSTSVSTGSVIIDGGMGIDKNVFCGGNVSAVEFFTTSDARLKMDVESIDQPLKLLDLMDPVKYKLNFRDDGITHYGVLAQDLQDQGLGDLVHETGDHLSVNYIDIIGILLASVQELKKEVRRNAARSTKVVDSLKAI